MASDYRQRPLAEPSPLPAKSKVHLGWTWGWQWEGTIPWGIQFDRISLSYRAELFFVVLMVNCPPIQTLPNFYFWNIKLSWSSEVLSLHNLVKIYLLQWKSLSLRAHWSLPIHPRHLASQLPRLILNCFSAQCLTINIILETIWLVPSQSLNSKFWCFLLLQSCLYDLCYTSFLFIQSNQLKHKYKHR